MPPTRTYTLMPEMLVVNTHPGAAVGMLESRIPVYRPCQQPYSCN
jgi:hypothetical protein